MVCGAVLALGLPRLLGDPARFGEFKVVNSLISILNMVVIVGTIQAVSRLVSERPRAARAIARSAARLQSGVAAGLGAAVWLGASTIAEVVFRDAGLAPLLRVAALVPMAYAIYGVYVGTINGLQRFADQAALDVLFSTLKALFIVGAVVAGFGVAGAFVGFAAAALCALLAGIRLVARRVGDASERADDTVARMRRLLPPLLWTTLMTNLLIQLDVLVLKAMAQGGAEAASHVTGLFGGARNVSLLPYQAIFALTLVVFPMASRAAVEEDAEAGADYLNGAMRFTVVVATLICVPLAAVATPLLAAVLGPAYAEAGAALVVLLPGAGALSVLVLGVTFLNATGSERAAAKLTAAAVAVEAGLLFALLRGSTPDLLGGAAIASTGAAVFGAVAALLVLRLRFGPYAPIATFVRALLVGGTILAVASLWSVSGLAWVLAKGGACGLGAIALFLATGELSASDRAAVRTIVGMRR